MVRIFTRIVFMIDTMLVRLVTKIVTTIIRISTLMVKKETGYDRKFMVIIIVRLVMRMVWIVLLMFIMMVARDIIMDMVSNKFGHLESYEC